jgi:uncharacterized protein YegJ (DUF2314 family)
MSDLKGKALVLGGGAVLAAVVVWALAKKDTTAPEVPALLVAEAAAPSDASADSAKSALVESDADASHAEKLEPIPHDSEVSVELAVIAPKATNAKLAELSALAPEKWALTAADCGSDCAGVRKFMVDAKGTVEVMAAADWILPSKDAISTVARSVPEAERAALYETKELLVVRVTGEDTRDHMPMRGAFALASAFARELRGYVHDEDTHRIDPASVFAERIPKTPIGTPFFVPESLLVALHPVDEEDVAGPYRLLTLGLDRYGAPDLEMRGFHEKDAAKLAGILNVVASKIAKGERGPTVSVSLADVASVGKKKTGDYTRTPEKSKDVTVHLALADRMPGDPDNDVYRIVPEPVDDDATDEEAYATLSAKLYGDPSRVLTEGTADPALLAAEARAKKAVPAAVAKWKKDGGSLTVRVPFAVPSQPGKSEVMWMKVTSCEGGVCKGTLASRPVFAKNLSVGAQVEGKLGEVSDYLLDLPDGTKEGGETISILEKGGR